MVQKTWKLDIYTFLKGPNVSISGAKIVWFEEGILRTIIETNCKSLQILYTPMWCDITYYLLGNETKIHSCYQAFVAFIVVTNGTPHQDTNKKSNCISNETPWNIFFENILENFLLNIVGHYLFTYINRSGKKLRFKNVPSCGAKVL